MMVPAIFLYNIGYAPMHGVPIMMYRCWLNFESIELARTQIEARPFLMHVSCTS